MSAYATAPIPLLTLLNHLGSIENRKRMGLTSPTLQSLEYLEQSLKALFPTAVGKINSELRKVFPDVFRHFTIDSFPCGSFELFNDSIEQTDQPEACHICTESYKKEERLLKLPCGHFHHSECVLLWLNAFGTAHIPAACPVCRHSAAKPSDLKCGKVDDNLCLFMASLGQAVQDGTTDRFVRKLFAPTLMLRPPVPTAAEIRENAREVEVQRERARAQERVMETEDWDRFGGLEDHEEGPYDWDDEDGGDLVEGDPNGGTYSDGEE